MDKIDENSLFCGNKDTFDNLFTIKDPWNLICDQEQLRYKIIIDFIKKNIYKPGLNVLEIGCAEGNFSEFLDKEKIKTTSLDISEVAISRANNKNLQNVKLICSEMLNYVRNNNIVLYDLILLMECFYYLSDERKNRFLKELVSKMSQDSVILLTMPVRKNHTMFLSEERLNNMFNSCGLRIIDKYGSIVLTLKGINGLLIKFIPTNLLKKAFISLHKYFFPFRINQKLFVFIKN